MVLNAPHPVSARPGAAYAYVPGRAKVTPGISAVCTGHRHGHRLVGRGERGSRRDCACDWMMWMPGCLLYVGGPRVGPTQWRRCWKLLGISGGGPESKSTSRGESRSPGESQRTEPRKMEDRRRKMRRASKRTQQQGARAGHRSCESRLRSVEAVTVDGRARASQDAARRTLNLAFWLVDGSRSMVSYPTGSGQGSA